VSRISRPRYRKHRRHSPHFTAFLAAMAAKFTGHETRVSASSVGSNVIVLASSPAVAGPFALHGAPPPELRDIPRFWATFDGSDQATLYQSRDDLAAERSPLTLASWALSFTFTDADVNAGTDVITKASHGMETGDGPVRTSNAGGALPAGLAAATDYYFIKVSANTFKLATSRANALAGTAINITAAAGGGTHTLTRAITVGIDLSEDGVIEWMNQGVTQAAMQDGDATDADTIFA
jgi:hypothetical protein